ncbi:pyridoxal-dependent decarboxylase domain protein [Dictyocaulus viviparus]|uniref:Aromatic-L-amino-acid decarboxylase n=1 Tax=Dictyocaulus viviparus TaxID=29172 RepID=A0A0D8XVR6_DICVI|nr:pyridoxal-dependent decarboxylase domain protein [Dictyocaulus viviparus]
MNSDEFRKFGNEMINYVADFWDHIRDRRPLPNIKPGYINNVVPSHPPSKPESWETIFNDLEDVVMKGNTYWHHPHFFAYFPTACSYPAIIADILSGGIAGVGFSWKSGPAMTELEMATLDWLVDVLALPQHFKNSHHGTGCGIIQNTASDSTVIAIMAARAKAVERIKNDSTSMSSLTPNGELEENKQADDNILNPYFHDPEVFRKFVAYCSDQAHSSVDKGAMLCGVKLRKLKSSIDPELKNYTVTKETLEEAIQEDRAQGLIPFILIATIGTTSSCGVDRLSELAPICNRENIWIHVDAAYAGSFLICPEFRYMSNGIELVDSFNFNAHKTMLMNFDCSPMWFKDGVTTTKYFNVDPTYLKHEHQAVAADYRHLQIALGRRFRALKIWFVIRRLGIEYIQNVLRKQNSQAILFAKFIAESDEFELFVPQHLGLVCFRIKESSNEENEELCAAINDDRRIHLVPSKVSESSYEIDCFVINEKVILVIGAVKFEARVTRLSVCSLFTTDDDIYFAFTVCREVLMKLKSKI